MHIDFMSEGFEKNAQENAIVWKSRYYTYGWLIDQLRYWREKLQSRDIKSGTVTVMKADFSPMSIVLFLALVDHGCILVPLSSAVKGNEQECIESAQGEVLLEVNQEEDVRIFSVPNVANHKLYDALRERRHPGLVFFSSGSTGKSKAAVHDMSPILDKFRISRHRLVTIAFLLYDHIGGVNTMLYTLSNLGCMVTVQDRSPDAVLSLVEKYKVELLPTSPTFINLMLLSSAYERYDLSSLKIVSYGTEPMPESTLKRLHDILPNAKLVQTYGLSELGILRSKSKGSDSLWVKVGGEGFQTRIVDGILQIKARSAMLGYLNAPSPFTADGWFITGDAVEVDGEFIRILGRTSEFINVGGEKVHPTEVENVIQQMENVAEVTVYGEKNPIVGNIVCARVRLLADEDTKEFVSRLKRFCSERLSRYKVPVKVTITDEKQHGERFKKSRA